MSESSIPWVEKYRPKRLDDVSEQDEVVATLRRSMQTANLPHLLLYGPPGTGKTSTILAVARELYGPDLMRRRILELNASSERGIDVIRTKVKDFAATAVGSRESAPGYPSPPYKLIILDEADSMTKDAQSALRRTMELFTKVTRFCIICNYVSRIIDPITSRCAKFRYRPINIAAVQARLSYIAENENVRFGDGALAALCAVSGGDLRQSITLMQTAAKIVADNKHEDITAAMINELACVIPPQIISHIHSSVQKNTFSALTAAHENVKYNAYSVEQCLLQWSGIVMTDLTIDEDRRADILIRMAESEMKLMEGADESLQLLDVMSYATQTINKPKVK